MLGNEWLASDEVITVTCHESNVSNKTLRGLFYHCMIDFNDQFHTIDLLKRLISKRRQSTLFQPVSPFASHPGMHN